jgi:methylthioribose-1-phosphate isomerase
MARNGDIANIIGINGLAGLVRVHIIPIYQPAKRSTIYMSRSDALAIPIVERPADENRIRTFFCDLGLQ